MHRAFLLVCLILATAALWLACGNSSGDDDDAATDDDAADDDESPADDDDNDDSSSDDDDDETPTGPAPLIDNLILTPDSGFAGDAIAISFHFQDLEGDVNGGQFELFLDGQSVLTATANTAGVNEGYIDFAYTMPGGLAAGDRLLEATLTDVGGHVSNKISATFDSGGVNTAPTISNLHFSPDPACTEANSPFLVIFHYVDEQANLSGGLVNIIVNDQFPPITGVLTGSGGAEGDLPLQLSFTDTVPNGESVNFKVQLVDNRMLGSNWLSGNLTFTDAACDE
jgi:hypothetical protein